MAAEMPEHLTVVIRAHRQRNDIFVTRPTMPDRADFKRKIDEIWKARWLTNAGRQHQDLEKRLTKYLQVPHLSLFCNGTIALLAAFRLFKLGKGEVITTPFTFPATVHSIDWMGLKPVFADVEPASLNLDPARVEAAITRRTRAILPVHVYGIPCDVAAFENIGRRHGIPVIYDAAHAFGARFQGRALAAYGDAAMLSFHATKLFSTIEGGALIVASEQQKKDVDLLKNFGIRNEETVLFPGINGKVNEFQAAFGLLVLDLVNAEIRKRRKIAAIYRKGLAKVPGLRFPSVPTGLEPNYAYFPVIIDAQAYGLDRDRLYACFSECGIKPRKYFYPLCSHCPSYRSLPSARPGHLPIAERASREVLCLPIYGDLPHETAAEIVEIIQDLGEAARAHGA